MEKSTSRVCETRKLDPEEAGRGWRLRGINGLQARTSQEAAINLAESLAGDRHRCGRKKDRNWAEDLNGSLRQRNFVGATQRAATAFCTVSALPLTLTIA
jgi:hypothetical protein